MPLPHLSIGTRTNRINLLGEEGYTLDGWEPGDTEYGTIFQESQLADYRQMAAYRDVTVFETLPLKLRTNSQNQAARAIQDMRSIIRLCLDFWTSTYQTSVVYLSARASCETNMRHAVVYDTRLIGESSPFGQPFVQVGGGAVMDRLNLIVERGPWLENVPGTGTCVEISSQAADNTMFALDFDGVDDEVDCGSGLTLDNLPDTGNLTVEAWIKADEWGENSSGFIIEKTGWELAIGKPVWESIYYGVWARAIYMASQAITYTGTDDFSIDGKWHHIAAVWTQADLRWDIAIDGLWVSTTVQAGAGGYIDDSGNDLIIGNNAAGTVTFDGLIGQCRVSSSARYTVGNVFTPPDRCACPTVDGDTEGLWCLNEGAGATAFDETLNNNDGTITGATWVWGGCEKEYQEATCDARSVFVANKHNVAQLTHAYFWDDDVGQWTDGGVPPENLIGKGTPFDFLPTVPNDDDFVIFGINTDLADSGPFSSLVFDISTVFDPGTSAAEWRYKGGGDTDDPATWTALTVQDNTDQGGAMTGDPFDTLGIGSVHWEQPADWVTSDPDPTGADAIGIDGYWVACYLDAAGGAAVDSPQQDNRDIYTVTWPYIEFAADEVGGDMPALLRLSVDSRSAQDGAAATTNLWCQRILAGLRSHDRGADFTAFVNLSNTQLPPGVTVTVWTNTVFTAVATAPTGNAARYTALAAEAMTARVYVRLFPDYYGRFHAFVRGKQVAGAAGAVGVRLGYAPADSVYPAVKFTTTRHFLNLNDDQLLDMGEIVLGPAVDTFPLEVSHTYIEVEASSAAVADSADFYELILIPIDEWAIDAEDMLKNSGWLGYTNDYWSHWEGDGIRNQRNILSNLIGTVSGKIARYWRPITNGLPILQTGKKQRLWFLHARYDDYADADDLRADSEIASTVQIWKQQRYSTLRGDR